VSNAAISDVTSFHPGSDRYAQATTPHNAVATQRPAMVAAPTSADQVAACVRHAAERGLRVVPQATGHGATGALGSDVLLLDTSGLDSIDIDPEQGRARAGAGCTWGAVDAAAMEHGLLGRAGSAPDVGITGFTFGAGAGWLTRPWGLASSALVAVECVDGTGTVRRAADDAPEERDRDAIWACRGGGGVGIAVTLEFDLVRVRVDDLWAGFRLWPIDALADVVSAWGQSLPRFGPALCTSLAVLQAPPMPLIPTQLHGQRVVHLALASSAGAGHAQPLLDALAAAPAPAVDTWGRSDVDRLGQIHLDPPNPVPSVGRARWLTDTTPAIALDALQVAARSDEIMMAEIRNIANDAPTRPGALDRAPGTFMLHAVGGPDDAGSTATLDTALDAMVAAASSADTGLAIGSWSDGRDSVPDALPADVRARVAAIADAVDPGRVLVRSPLIAGL